MYREEASELLDVELGEYRQMSYGDLSAMIGHEESLVTVGRAGTEYQIDIQIRWDHEPGGYVRVMASIDDGMCVNDSTSLTCHLVMMPEEYIVDNQS